MNIIEKLKAGLLLKRAADRLEEASMKGHLKAGVFALGASIVAALVSQIHATCPGLLEHWPELLTTAVLAGIGVYVRAPKDEAK